MGDHRFNKTALDLTERLASGNAVQVKDRLGRPLEPGDHVVIDLGPNAQRILLWRIVNLVPNLDPRQDTPTITVQMVGTFNLVVPRGIAGANELLRVLTAAETQQVPGEAPAQAAPETPPTITEA